MEPSNIWKPIINQMTILTVFNDLIKIRTNLLIDEIIGTWSDPRFLKFLIPQLDLKLSLHGGIEPKPKVIP
jgi:hypothetical protein